MGKKTGPPPPIPGQAAARWARDQLRLDELPPAAGAAHDPDVARRDADAAARSRQSAPLAAPSTGGRQRRARAARRPPHPVDGVGGPAPVVPGAPRTGRSPGHDAQEAAPSPAGRAARSPPSRSGGGRRRIGPRLGEGDQVARNRVAPAVERAEPAPRPARKRAQDQDQDLEEVADEDHGRDDTPRRLRARAHGSAPDPSPVVAGLGGRGPLAQTAGRRGRSWPPPRSPPRKSQSLIPIDSSGRESGAEPGRELAAAERRPRPLGATASRPIVIRPRTWRSARASRPGLRGDRGGREPGHSPGRHRRSPRGGRAAAAPPGAPRWMSRSRRWARATWTSRRPGRRRARRRGGPCSCSGRRGAAGNQRHLGRRLLHAILREHVVAGRDRRPPLGGHGLADGDKHHGRGLPAGARAGAGDAGRRAPAGDLGRVRERERAGVPHRPAYLLRRRKLGISRSSAS